MFFWFLSVISPDMPCDEGMLLGLTIMGLEGLWMFSIWSRVKRRGMLNFSCILSFTRVIGGIIYLCDRICGWKALTDLTSPTKRSVCTFTKLFNCSSSWFYLLFIENRNSISTFLRFWGEADGPKLFFALAELPGLNWYWGEYCFLSNFGNSLGCW